MKLTILGATGSVGRELTRQAISAGHDVTVLVRDPDKLGELRSHVTIVQGDVTNASAINNAITGNDAVLNTLGHTKNSPNDVLALATSNTVTAMNSYRIRRLVVLSNTALSSTDDAPTFGQRLQKGLMGLAMAQINRDHSAQAELIANSKLDWTIVRAAMLTDGPKNNTYHVSKLDSNAGSRVTRANVADFMLTSAISGKYLHEMPVISQ